jgi:hypothetical protein
MNDEHRQMAYLYHLDRWLTKLCIILGAGVVLAAMLLGPSMFGFGLGVLLLLFGMGLLLVRLAVG